MRWIKAVGAAAAAVGLTAVSPASAATPIFINFSFSLDNGDSASGVFLAEKTATSGVYQIDTIFGALTDPSGLFFDSMTLLPPEPGGTFNDNLVYTGQPNLDFEGLGFTAYGAQWAIWSNAGVTVDSWCNNSVLGQDHRCDFASDPNGAVTNFSAVPLTSSTPEPAAWALMILGVGALGARLRGRRRGAVSNLAEA
jgi:hypothetical protein